MTETDRPLTVQGSAEDWAYYDGAVVRAVIRRILERNGIDTPLEFELEPIFRRLCLGFQSRTWHREDIIQEARASVEAGMGQDELLRTTLERELYISVRDTKTATKDLLWLKEHGADQSNIERFKQWWRKNFRGRDGNPPSLSQVVEFWPAALHEDYSPGGYDGYTEYAKNG